MAGPAAKKECKVGWGWGWGAVWAVTLSFIIREPQRQQPQANETVALGRMAVESFSPTCHVTDASVKALSL